MRLPSFGRPTKGPYYKKRLLDPSKLITNAVIRRYWRDPNGTWQYEDYTITRNGAFTHEGSLWTTGRKPGAVDQDYISLSDMGIVPRRNGKYATGAYTVLLKPGRR
jgi:hypothetical protein